MFSIPERYNAEKRPFNPPAGRHKVIIPSGYNKDQGFYGSLRLDMTRLASDLELSPSYISKIFSGTRRPSAAVLVRMSRKLGLDSDTMFQLIQYMAIQR